jgi:hypothetical protein
MRILPALSLLVCASAAVAAPADSVVAPPPASAVYVVIYKSISPEPELEPEASSDPTAAPAPVPAPKPVIDPALKALLPSHESEDAMREVEYVIAGTAASMTVRNGGRLLSVRYFAGPFIIRKPLDGSAPRVMRAPDGNADSFRYAYPYTEGFQARHSKGRVLLEGRQTILYEIPESELKTLRDTVAKADEENPVASRIQYLARRLWVEESSRRPLLAETDDDIIRYEHKGPAPAQMIIPNDCLTALKRHVDSTRVQRAKPY